MININSKMMHLLLDGRAFSLQSKGGVSQMWCKLMASRCFQELFSLSIFLYPGHDKNIHLLESNILANNNIRKIFCSIPPSDNLNFSDSDANSKRKSLVYDSTKEDQPDIVINSYYGENIYPDCRRYMIVVHDFAHEEVPLLRNKPSTEGVIKRKLESMEKATELVYISGSTRKCAVNLYPHLTAAKSRVIYHGHDTLSSFPEKKKSRFIHIGTRSGYKNFGIIARVFTRILKTNPDVSLLVIGGEPEDAYTRNLTNTYPNQVTFITNISDEEVMKHLASSDVYISASFYEGFGIPVLNALHAGTKLILSDISPYREIASHYAHYFDPSDEQGLEHCVANTLDLEKLIQPNCHRSWERVAYEYSSFILNQSTL